MTPPIAFVDRLKHLCEVVPLAFRERRAWPGRGSCEYARIMRPPDRFNQKRVSESSEQGAVPVEAIVTATFPLERVAEAFAAVTRASKCRAPVANVGHQLCSAML